ncbi:MAG TPA: lycopene cyclase domain-containing protein [Candidatus Dormibacteraeota bacterium]|nr:lycopene cyclase domain-containing protein [Candidatus Dormibacteraeota bacterium]
MTGHPIGGDPAGGEEQARARVTQQAVALLRVDDTAASTTTPGPYHAVHVTYLEFLAIFLVPPIAALIALERRTLSSRLAWQIGAIAAVAIVYTAPWDRQLIVDHVWTYPAAQVLGGALLRVPVEEYGFYTMQVVLAGLLTAALLRHSKG